MKRLLLGAVASFVLAATGFAGASAQGTVTTNWGGLYLGVNGTFQSNNTTLTFTGVTPACTGLGCAGTAAGVLAPATPANGSFSQHGNGNGFGGQLGFNVQHGRLVYGADIAYDQNSLVIDSLNNLGPNVTGGNIDYQTVLKSSVLGTIRIGIANNSTLYYVKGGAALGRFASNINTETLAANPAPPPALLGTPASFNQTHVTGGFTWGAGADWAFDPHNPNLMAGIEYDHTRFNDVAFGGVLNPNNTFPVSYNLNSLNLSEVVVRFSYKLP